MRKIDADSLLKMMSHWKPYMDMDKVREAIRKMPNLTPQNDLLTLNELRKMDGQPVWIKQLKDLSVCDTGGARNE